MTLTIEMFEVSDSNVFVMPSMSTIQLTILEVLVGSIPRKETPVAGFALP